MKCGDAHDLIICNKQANHAGDHSGLDGACNYVDWPAKPYSLPTVVQAQARRDQSMALVDAKADAHWKSVALDWIRDLSVGEEFLGEELRAYLQNANQVPHDWRALGPQIHKAAKQGLIIQIGVGRARTSNMSNKPIWQRVGLNP
jgi:hypothetical protein